ncbi:MAG: hypothetical protein JWQ98_3325 [Chlorobi bacterium]|nr:hypothetical protein [Chlorobiota bacterium]
MEMESLARRRDVPRFAEMIDELLDVALPRFPGRSLLLRDVAVRLLGLRRFQSIVDAAWGRAADGCYMSEVLREMEITWDIMRRGSVPIPEHGPLIAVANHPTGMLEGLILAEMLRSVRQDARVMALHLLSILPGLRDELILVDPYGRSDSPRFNIGPMREALRWLRDGNTLGMFPAGAVSKPIRRERRVADTPWSPTLARLVRRSGATVLPVYFSINNRFPFHLVGMINRGLQAPLIVRELLNKQGMKITVMVGDPISPHRMTEFAGDAEMAEFLRRETYALAATTE